MEPVGSFQGLASGINFRDLVDQIIIAESRPVVLMEQRKAEIDRESIAWGDFESRVRTVEDRSEDLSDGLVFNTYNTAITGLATNETAPLSASASTSAVAGSYSVQVLQLATKEKVASAVFADRTTALGFTGEFLVSGKAISLASTDSLNDLAALVNAANAGADPSEVSAGVVGNTTSGYRLVLTADDTGAAGIDLADGSTGALGSLGYLDTTTSIKNKTSDGAKSDKYISSTAAVATLAGLATPPASGSVTIGGFSVTIDLSSDSLGDIASAINTAAGAASSAVTAQVVEETDADGNTFKRLDISSTTSFTDTNHILETLGVLEGGRSAVQQQIQGAAFTDGDAVTVATGSTLLTDFWGGGSSAAVASGDTLTLSGTRGDGTTFTKTFTVGVSSTYQDLVDSLNSASDAFGSGSRTATAAIDASGRLLLTDDTGGDSQLALSVVAHNEGGGTLDFGAFSTSTAGRDREITAGVDAQLQVDGAFYSRSGNTVNDVVDGLTLTLSDVSSSAVFVDVSRDVNTIVSNIESFIKSYNTVVEFVNSQFTGAGAEEGDLNRPLSGSSTIRGMRTKMRAALQTTIASTVTDVDGLTELGIELGRTGVYDIDSAKLRTAIENDPIGVQRYFAVYGAGSTGTLDYVSSGKDTESGTYAVVITAAATQASVTGSGFGGTYVDDATADTLTITDIGTNSVYEVSLTNGMTMTQIVDAVNTQLQTATTRQLDAANVMKSDAVGTNATDSTLLQDLYDSGGTNLGVADADVFTISGAGNDGTSFFQEWTITDVTTQTLGDLRAEIGKAIGTEVVLEITNGVLSATAVAEGRKAFTLAVSSDNAGGGTFNLGSFTASEEGRGKAAITASDASSELKLGHDDYGVGKGFTIAYTAGGTDGSASLGLSAATYKGIDVAAAPDKSCAVLGAVRRQVLFRGRQQAYYRNERKRVWHSGTAYWR